MTEIQIVWLMFVLCGCIGVLTCVVGALAVALYLRCRSAARISSEHPPAEPAVEPQSSPETGVLDSAEEELRKAQEEFEAEQAAFRRLLSYNPAVAYGLDADGGDT